MHNTRVAWIQCSGKQKIELVKQMADIDSDAVVKMKEIGRMRVRKDLSDVDDMKEYYEYIEVWLEEFGGAPPELAPWQKMGVMTYAHAIAP